MKLRHLLVLSLMLFAAPGGGVRAESGAPGIGAAYQEKTRAAVREVLSLREFSGAKGESWWTQIVHGLSRIIRWIGGLFDGLPVWLVWIILIWLILTLVAILIHVLYVLFGLVGGRRTAGGEAASASGMTLFGIQNLALEHVRARATALMDERQWRESIKYLYVAAILVLDRAGLIQFRPEKTNHEFLSELRSNSERQEQFARLTRRFEWTIYGAHEAEEAHCREMSELLERVERGADQQG